MADVDIDREALRKEIDAALHGKKKEPQPPAGFELNQHSSVKHVIGVVSGKGGVGKSFVAVKNTNALTCASEVSSKNAGDNSHQQRRKRQQQV